MDGAIAAWALLASALSCALYSPDANSAPAPSSASIKARIARAPRPVAAFIERRAGCNHFAGEEPYDRERAAQLNMAARDLRCSRLDRDEQMLHHTYRQRPVVLRLLTDTADMDGWEP